MSEKKRFEGSDNYVATDDLRVAVNAAMAEVVGVVEETGTLAMEVARAIEEQRGIIGTIDGRVAVLREISRTNAVASEHITAAMNDLAALADGTRRRAGAAADAAAAT